MPTSRFCTAEVRKCSILPTNVFKCVNACKMALIKQVFPKLVKPTCPGRNVNCGATRDVVVVVAVVEEEEEEEDVEV